MIHELNIILTRI